MEIYFKPYKIKLRTLDNPGILHPIFSEQESYFAQLFIELQTLFQYKIFISIFVLKNLYNNLYRLFSNKEFNSLENFLISIQRIPIYNDLKYEQTIFS